MENYRWITKGFNRKEKARLAKLRKKRKLNAIQMMLLKTSPVNVPAKRGKTNNPKYGGKSDV